MGHIRHENLRIHVVVRDNLRALQKTFGSFHQAAASVPGARDVPGIVSVPWLRIYVQDDGSSPRYADQIRKFIEKEKSAWTAGHLSFERSAFPRGYAQAHNELLQSDPEAPGFLMVVLAGMEVAPDFFTQLQDEVLPLSPDKPRIFLPFVRFQRRSMMGGNISRFRCLARGRKLGPSHNKPFYVGPSFIVPFRIFSRTLGWDPKMPAACSEIELSLRMNDAAWHYVLSPQLRLNHARKLRILRDSRFFRARLLLVRRHLSGARRKLALAIIYAECAFQAVKWFGMSSKPQEAIDLVRDTMSGKPI